MRQLRFTAAITALLMALVLCTNVVPDDFKHQATFIAHVAETPPNGQCGDALYWFYDEQTYSLTILGEGNMFDYDYMETPWSEYLSGITNIYIQDGASSIGENAFSCCSY